MFRSMSDDDAHISGSVIVTGIKNMVMLCNKCKKSVYLVKCKKMLFAISTVIAIKTVIPPVTTDV